LGNETVIERTNNQRTGLPYVSMLAKVLTLSTLVSALILINGCSSKKGPTEGDTSKAPEISVSTFTAAEESVDVVRELPGTTSSELHSILASNVSGRVLAVDVTEGSLVSTGQALVHLDARHIIAGKQAAVGAVGRTEAEIVKANSALELERATSLTRIQDAEATLSGAKASLAIATERKSITAEGARSQEIAQARSAVVQADASVRLATLENDRMRGLLKAGAIPQRDVDKTSVALEQATAQRNIVRQQLTLLEEGARQQERSASVQTVLAAEAAVRQAEAGVSAARAGLKQVLVRQADLNAAKAALISARATVADANISLNDSVIRAPFAGRIVRRIADPGVLASPGTPLIEIDGGKSSFDIEVPEALISRFKVGNNLRIAIPVVGPQDMSGVVRQITPQASGMTHAYKVRLSLPDTVAPMTGIYGIAKITVARRKAIMLDEMSIRRRDGLSYVYIVTSDGLAQSRVVTLGTPVGRRFPVASGLAVGDVVIRESVAGLTDGVRVNGARQ
jgi:HlyD family secretion protein